MQSLWEQPNCNPQFCELMTNFATMYAPNATTPMFSGNLFKPTNQVDSSPQLLFLKALIAALTSGLGGVPLYFLGSMPPSVMGFCTIFAAGLMMGCSVVLFMEAVAHSTLMYACGACLVGATITALLAHYVEDMDNVSFGGLTGKNANKALLIVLSMGLHSLGEGISVGVSARAEEQHVGLLVVVSLAIHNIPEGIATSVILMSKGMPVGLASLYAVITNLPQPLIALPAFIFFDYFSQMLPLGFGLAAGAMSWVVGFELIPESAEHLNKSLLLSTFFSALGIILATAVCASHSDFIASH